MRYVTHRLATEGLCRPDKARNRNHPLRLVLGVLFLLTALTGQVKAQTAPASITVSGACLTGTYVLEKAFDNYENTGRPAYQGSGTATINGMVYAGVGITVYYVPSGPAWVMAFDGQPYQSNPATSTLPPTSGWVVVTSGTIGNCTGTVPLYVPSGTVAINPTAVQTVCAGSPVVLTATPTNLAAPVSYTWKSSPAGFTGTGATFNQNAPSVNAITSYVITVTATSGTSSATASVGVTVKPAPVLVAGTPTNPTTCGGSNGSIAFTTTNLPNGTYSLAYTGSGSPKNVNVSNNAFTLTGLSAGTYSNFSLTTDGCTGSVATARTLSDPPAPAAGLINNGPLSCTLLTGTLTASGGGTYAFSNGASQIGGSSGNTATVSNGGIYSVTVTGANGCTATANTNITENKTAPTASINPTTTTLTCPNPTATLTA
ncbi:MAG TPA: hypothetical protein VGB67_11040, partial [Fibrella sp.]